MMSPYSDPVLATLETLIAPGGRAQISPFIQAAQAAVLFGEEADSAANNIRNIENQLRSKPEVITRLGDVWDRFYNQKSFSDPKWYQEKEFLDFYLAYYFPVNVAKLQLNLIQYLRREKQFPNELSVVEVGVGTGTTIAAIADFLLAWDSAARIYGTEAPVQSFQYVGIDRSVEARNVASKVTLSLARSIEASGDATQSLATKVITGLRNANWIGGDPIKQDFSAQFSVGNLAVLSYVLDEVHSEADQLALAAESINMPDGGILFVLEPGGERTSTNLMRLREQLLSQWPNTFGSTGPCGNVLGSKDKLEVCGKCWNARQQNFAESRLYRAVRKACHIKRTDRRSFDEFENSLLSWSYFWMTRGTAPKKSKPRQTATLLSADSGPWPQSITLHYRRRISQRSSNIRPAPSQPLVQSSNSVVTNSTNPLFDHTLVNKALALKDGNGSDKAVLLEAMRNKSFREAESIARGMLGTTTQNPIVPLGKVEFFPEHGPDDGKTMQETLLYCFQNGSASPLEVHLPRPMGFLTEKFFHGDEVVVDGADYQRTANKTIVLLVNSETKMSSPTPVDRSWATASPSDKVLDSLAYRFFGFPELRPFQRKVINRALSGESILAIAATGSGKSECFILPAMLSQGVTIVVSPLVSLMSDQYEQRIRDRYGLDYLTTIFHGTLSLNEKNSRLRRLELGYYKLAYFTPEQLERDYILDSLRRTHNSVGIRFLAADEAHCIAQWGHDFRPAYLNLYKRLTSLGVDPVRIALTATASPNVRKDICEELDLDLRSIDDGGDVYLESSNRPELNLIVRAVPNTGSKADDIVERLKTLQRQNLHNDRPGAAIVFSPLTGGDPNQTDYKSLRATPNGGKFSAGVAKLGSFLESQLGKRISIYHSKMDMEDEQPSNAAPPPQASAEIGDLSGRTRQGEQRAFIEGDTDVMVATKGFGMGIDKDNIRLVLHRSPPANLEAYAQEAGRAGRDGDLADVILYYSPDNPPDSDSPNKKVAWSDHDIQTFFLDSKYIRRIDVELIRAWILNAETTAFGSYYLTTPDIIDFAELVKRNPHQYDFSEPFDWPDFEPYPNYIRAFGDHLEILQRGHWFDCVGDYINRVLQALYRMRPEIDGKRRAFLNKADKCGIEFIWRGSPSIHATQAITSNLYFGQTFRDAGITASDLSNLITRNPTTEQLAARLGLSLRDTFSLLQDLKAAETKPPLVSFLWIDVPRKITSPAIWRERYGARTRIKPPLGKDPTVDDWFPAKSLSRPRGWEIQVGDGFRSTSFESFLDRFVALHDERESNDKKSYQRLLTDYIGVTATGSLRSGEETRQCLRSVLLGYLETGELVDGNCRSCSNCVADERKLADFSIEARREVVVRMTPNLKALFDKLRQQVHTIASENDSNAIFDAIRTEELAGRSLRGYFAGWSGKLLDESPGHLTALWLRLCAMARSEVLMIETSQFVSHASMISKSIDATDYERLALPMLEVEPLLTQSLDHMRELASTYGRINRPQDMSRVLRRLADSKDISVGVRLEVVDQIRGLHTPSGPLQDPLAYESWTLKAAYLETDFDKSLVRYRECVTGWGADQTLKHSHSCPTSENKAALWLAWASISDDHMSELAEVFSDVKLLDELTTWGTKALEVYQRISPAALIASNKALSHYLSIGNGGKRPLLLTVAGISSGRSMSDSDTEKIAGAILAIYSSWRNVCEDVSALGFPSDNSRAAARLLKHLAAHSGDGKLPSEVATHLLAKSDSKAVTFEVMSATSMLRLSAISAYRSVFIELIDRAQLVPKADWPSFQKMLSTDTNPQTSCPNLLVKLLVDIQLKDGPNSETFVTYVNTLAAELPNEQIGILNQIVKLAEPFIRNQPNCQRAIAAVKDCIGDTSSELDIWLRLSQDFPPLTNAEVSRSLLLLTKDDRWNAPSERTSIISTLVGVERSGNDLAGIVSPVIKAMPLNEFSAWVDSTIDSPNLWVALWVAWLRKNPAITHFQGLLKRNSNWLTTVAQSADASKQILLEFLSFDVVAESADLRALTIKSLPHLPHAANHVASWIKCERNLSVDEVEGIKAFVSIGPQELMGRDSVINYWTILKTHYKSAFMSSCAGIERWLSTLSVPGVPIDESILDCLANAVSSAKLDRDLVRIVAKLNLTIDSAPVSDDSKATIRSHIREVRLCRECNGTRSAVIPCISCGGSGSTSTEATEKDICDRCGGDGGAGGRCPKCYGSGWMEKTIHNFTKCSSCAGVGSHSMPCVACEQNGVVPSIPTL